MEDPNGMESAFTPDEVVGVRKNSAFDRFQHWCKSLGIYKVHELFSLTEAGSHCSVCNEAVEEGDGDIIIHLFLLNPTDKPFAHGKGVSEKEAKERACRKAIDMLEAFEPEIFSLKRKRLRVRLEDFGSTLPKTENMLLLEGDKEEGLEGLPQVFVDLITALIPEDTEEAPQRMDLEQIRGLSEKLLLGVQSMKPVDAAAVVNKLGLSYCDEMNLGMNAWLFAAILALVSRLRIESLVNDEKLKLSFSKVMEQVLIFNGDTYPGFDRVVARLIRFFAINRALPFMSRNRLESIGVHWSIGGVAAMKLSDVEFLAKDNEAVLRQVVASKTPPEEYLNTLFTEFSQINIVIKDLFGVDGSIYGSLVNGFPTSSSDIDVVINLPEETEVGGEELIDDEGEERPPKGVAELNRLHDAIKERFGDEFSVSKIESARVPILIVKKGDKIELNISFNHQVVIHNSALLRAYSSVSPRVRELVVLVKHWAKKREINDALQGTLSSYSYVLLVIAFLQKSGLLPDLQNPPESVFPVRPLPQRITDNGRCSTWFLEDGADKFPDFRDRLDKKSLTELFIQFCEYYLYEFNFITDLVAISSRVLARRGAANEEIVSELGGGFKKRAFLRDRDDPTVLDVRGLRKRTWLAIIDPFEVGRVLGTSARGMECINKEMKRAVELLLDGQAAEIFTEYSRRDRSQLPPFPAKKLERNDFVESSGGGFRKEFRADDLTTLETLRSILTRLPQKLEIDSFKILCYLTRIGMPTDSQLNVLKLVVDGQVCCSRIDTVNESILRLKSRQPTTRAPQVDISTVRRDMLSHHPDPRFRPDISTGKGEGKGHSGKGYTGKGKGSSEMNPGKGKGKGSAGKGQGKGSMVGRQVGTA